MDKTIIFTEKAIKVHNNKYSYESVNYINAKTNIAITCKTHGNFEQKPYNHLSGTGCPKCALEERSKIQSFTKKEFIEEAIKTHGDKYDYSLVKYKNNKAKVKIICKTHGVFEQTAFVHKKGSGCMKCHKDNVKLTVENFIERCNPLHNNKFNYNKVNFKNTKDKVIIGCPIHGDFKQTVESHLRGADCKKCSDNNRKPPKRSTTEEFIEKSNIVHDNYFNYTKTVYVGVYDKLTITCPVHGDFQQQPNNHLTGYGCGKCGRIKECSQQEKDIHNFIGQKIEFRKSDREILEGKELDIYIPSKNLAIEYNGLYWHSDKFKDKDYHLNKTLQCKEKGIQLIHIFEDEWLFKKDIVKSRLNNLLGQSEKLYARNCEIKEVLTKDKSNFLDQNHIQGKVGSEINLGLYYNNKLVSIMTFGKLRKNLGSEHKDGSYELLRFCNKLNTTVIGGASKLITYFKKNYNWKEVVSYADMRWSNGNLYNQLGFKESHISEPNYFYTSQNKSVEREPRFKYRKDILVSQGYDASKTEKQIMEERGYNRIYDCGSMKFILRNN